MLRPRLFRLLPTIVILFAICGLLAAPAFAVADAPADRGNRNTNRAPVRAQQHRMPWPSVQVVTDGLGNFLYVRLDKAGKPGEVMLSNRVPDNLAQIQRGEPPLMFVWGGSRVSFGRGGGMKVMVFPAGGGVRMSGKKMPEDVANPVPLYMKAAVGPDAAPLPDWLKAQGWPTWLDDEPKDRPKAAAADRPAADEEPAGENGELTVEQIIARAKAKKAAAEAKVAALRAAREQGIQEARDNVVDGDGAEPKAFVPRAETRPDAATRAAEGKATAQAVNEPAAKGQKVAPGQASSVKPASVGRPGEQTEVHSAVHRTPDEMKALIDQGADLNGRDTQGKTPLHQAIFFEKDEIAKHLIDAGAELNAGDKRGKTPLHMAVMFDREVGLNLLLNAGAATNLADAEGQLPLDMAVFLQREAMVNALLKAGSPTDYIDYRGRTPLTSAVFFGRMRIMHALLDAGASVDLPDGEGRRPLGIAIRYRKGECIEPLLKAGASLDVVDENGRTPLEAAEQFRQDKVVALIKAEMQRRAAAK